MAAPARRVVERWLADLAPQRYGLPPAAVLVVRLACAPLQALSPHSTNDPLAALARRAVRPATAGRVGAAVDAVWFADDAELLACLARDAMGGLLPLQWWWAALLGRAADAMGARQHWQASARVVPQAMAALAPSGADRAWVQSWGRDGRAAMLQALAAQFPVCAEVQAVLAACEDVTGRSPGLRRVSSPAPVPEPWAADAATVMLRLLGLLRADPQRAGDPRTAAVIGLTAWRTVIAAGAARGVQAAVREPARGPAAVAAPVLAPPASTGAMRVPQPGPQRRPLAAAPVAGTAPAGAVATARTDAAHAGMAAVETARADAETSTEAGTRADPRADTKAGTRWPPAVDRATPAPAVAEGPSQPLATRFGGVFFLLNVALAFGFYGDFTRPLQPGLPVSPWRFLHDAARGWLGRRLAADPLDAWLRERFADTQATPMLPAAWQVEDAWLQAFATDARPWHAVADATGLWLRHPAGFIVARRAGASAADLAALPATLAPGHGNVLLRTSRRNRQTPSLLKTLRPLVAARIGLALGIPARAAVHLLLTQPARLQASAGRLDVYLTLAHLPLALRLAGLDRDPGWVPAAGCDVRCHFD